MKNLHKWDLSYKRAIDIQKRLSNRVTFAVLKKWPRLIAGLDCAFTKDGRIIAAVIVLKLTNEGDFEIIETRYAVQKVNFPYIPGLLSFREAPVRIKAVEKLKSRPEVFLIDGQGIAHPRRLGLAAHLGLFFDKPTIGCAKSRLIGSFDEPPLQKGTYTLLKDKKEILGAVVRTRTNVKPIYVSVGNRCTLQDAIKITLAAATKYRLPEPTRLAHNMVTKLKTQV